MSTDHAYCTPEVADQAAGAIEAQQLVDAIADGRLEPQHAWVAFTELQGRHGRNAQALKAFVIRLAKAARTVRSE
ncbi:hypothetical protein [Rhizobacter sp. SG703]|uniref:hypothetical protein n=1 Tax=Rhizobacter sp. SG703 TaxID=2587140 RepID=UPI0014479A39|nr:hypothetical protein [Rhizobacter sp. SG703]NKI96626.1 hypothetical protein [Rhizobacter sp. SG703]